MFAAGNSAAAASGAINYVEDVFSTYLYTGNGSTQTINNGIALSSAYGGSTYFDGAGDYLSLASNAAFTVGTGNLTIEAWVYITSFGNGYGGIMSGRLLTTEYPGLGLVIDANRFSFTIFNNSAALKDTVDAPTNQWVHVAGVRSGTNTALFVNGVRKASSINSENGTSSAMNLGRFYPETNDYYFNGYISNARLVKGTAVYDPTQATLTVPTSPLTAISGTSLLTCQSPSPTTDYSANAFAITVNNAIAQNGGGPFIDSTAGKGGLVWGKSRSNAYDNFLADSVRGSSKLLYSNNTYAQQTDANVFSSFNSNGFSLGIGGAVSSNTNGATYASWTFREQPKFFDVVTFTTPASGVITVNHNLGSIPGCVIVKATALSQLWVVNHRSLAADQYLVLNTTAAQTGGGISYTATSTTVTYSAGYLSANETYVAYLFAHNAGGFGLTGTDNVISCGSYTTDGSGKATVDLGYEPQWLLRKRSDAVSDWIIVDNMRGWPLGSAQTLASNNSDQEFGGGYANSITSTGFTVSDAASRTYVYIAIRRGPMKVPTLGTTVFSPQLQTPPAGANNVIATNSGFPIDWLITRQTSNVKDWYATSRLTNNYLSPNLNSAEGAYQYGFDKMAGVGGGVSGWDAFLTASYSLRRAPGFFDVVCYTGTGVARTVTHNLGVVPELMIAKCRNDTGQWAVYSFNLTASNYLFLNSTAASATNTAVWNATAPTSSVFSVGTSLNTNSSGFTFVAYLFATCPGVSKVGSYTGTGALQTVACGFTSGARYVLIKRTDSTGDWYVWDSARGITSGNDPYLLLNSTAAEVTSTNYVDTDTTGFKVTAAAPAALNASGGTYIFLAIA